MADVEAYGHQFPAYRENPIAETLRAVAGLAADPDFSRRCAAFLRDMVYDSWPTFEVALATIASLVHRFANTATYSSQPLPEKQIAR
jgi:hypothetical protein